MSSLIDAALAVVALPTKALKFGMRFNEKSAVAGALKAGKSWEQAKAAAPYVDPACIDGFRAEIEAMAQVPDPKKVEVISADAAFALRDRVTELEAKLELLELERAKTLARVAELEAKPANRKK